MFDQNIPKNNRLTFRDDPWTLVDEEFGKNQIDTVSNIDK